jgi:endonuclease YncB( thermonuclease family)
VKYWEIIAANIRRPEDDRGPCTTSALILATVALLPFVTLAQHAPPAQPFQRLDGCVLTPDEWTDGDSFRVRLPDGRLATFRLYFVDTTESRSRGVRSDEQAAYFGLTRTEAIELGQKAKAFTAGVLQKPFTIQTRWRTVFGPTRYYAVVLTADGYDLAELLVKNGLARIYGTRTPLPDGRNSRTYLAHLAELEAQAKTARRGGWVKAKP